MNGAAFINDLAELLAGLEEKGIPPVPPVYVRSRGELRAAAAALAFEIPTEQDVDNMIATGTCCGRPIVWLD